MKKILFLLLVFVAPCFGQDLKINGRLVDEKTNNLHGLGLSHCYNCTRGLSKYRTAIAGAKEAATNIVIVGDSVSAGANGTTTDTNGWAWQWQYALERRFGNRTDSVWAVDTLTGSTSRWNPVVGSWTGSLGGSFTTGGIRGWSYAATGASSNLRVTNLYGTVIEIYYVENPDTSASWTYKIDSGSAVTVTQSTATLAAARTKKVTVTGLSLANHQLDIFGPASGNVVITGCAAFTSSTGVRVHNWSQSGYGTNQYLAGEASDNRTAALTVTQPSLIVAGLFLNDVAADVPSSVAVATYKTRLQGLIDAQTYGSVLLFAPNPRATSNTPRAYLDALLDLCNANPDKVALLSGFDYFGGSNTEFVTNRGMSGDNLHPNAAGHRALLNLFLDAITPAGDGNGVIVAKNNSTTEIGPQRVLNLIEGSNITLTVADDPANKMVDVTIAAAGGGGGIVTAVCSDIGDSTTATTASDVAVKTCTIPANTLANNNERLRVEIWGRLGATGGNSQVKIKFGGTTILDSTSLALGDQAFRVVGDIVRTGAATQIANFVFTASVAPNIYGVVANGTASVTLSGSAALDFVVNQTAASSTYVKGALVTKWTP